MPYIWSRKTIFSLMTVMLRNMKAQGGVGLFVIVIIRHKFVVPVRIRLVLVLLLLLDRM